MSELDEVYDSYDSNNRQYSKEEYAEYKRNEKTQIYEMIDKTAKKIVTNGEEFKKYLDSQSKFDNYSVGNALLVTAQMPKATQLRDLDSWASVNAYKKKFAKFVKILEPGDSYMREDGSVGVNYNVKKVYDITQVNTRQKPRNMRYDDKILLRIFLNSSNAKVNIVDQIPYTDRGALYNQEENVLYIARGAEAPKIFHEVTEELAFQDFVEQKDTGDVALENFKAACVSYMICKKYNIDVSNYNFSNIPVQLQNMDAKEIREELEPIRNAMENVNSRINAYIQRLTRENKSRENER